MKKNFEYIHCSGRYDRPGHLLDEDVRRWIKQSSLITMTECQSPSRRAALRQHGWSHYKTSHDPSDDTAVMWEKSVFSVVHLETVRISKKTFFRPTGHKSSPIWASVVILKHVATGKNILVSVVHLPSHIEGDFHTNKSRPVSFRAGVRGWKKAVYRIAKNFGVKDIIMTADWNLNYKKPWVRAYFRVNFPRFRPTWSKTKPLPRTGTHTNRIIDIPLVRGLRIVKAPRILGVVRSSDHKPFIQTLGLR